MSDFFRFPHTPNLDWLSNGKVRDDKVLTTPETEAFLAHTIVLEEKVDGANLGFSVDSDGNIRAQNRGQYLHRPFIGQFSRLNGWLAIHEEALFDALGEYLILFGEWVAAVHSLEYTSLPDYFLVFDVYDRSERRFWSTARRNAFTSRHGLHHIHQVGTGHYQLDSLKQTLTTAPSFYRDGGCEGIYLRHEDKDWLIARAKLVQPDFVQSIGEHWRSRSLRWNALALNANRPD
ncbi:MAG: RNA ligase family protein [Candidatus Thiodiazotropha sp. (ex Dulcina madagascariensis)]|nr:RNA ligase family protein [Candidatus Thiodiazotropha sp. (ex Dulcina madagascariensis)]